MALVEIIIRDTEDGSTQVTTNNMYVEGDQTKAMFSAKLLMRIVDKYGTGNKLKKLVDKVCGD